MRDMQSFFLSVHLMNTLSPFVNSFFFLSSPFFVLSVLPFFALLSFHLAWLNDRSSHVPLAHRLSRTTRPTHARPALRLTLVPVLL